MGAPVRFQKAVPRTKEKRRGEAPIGATARVMGRLFPSAEGTGFAVRQATGCGVPHSACRRFAPSVRGDIPQRRPGACSPETMARGFMLATGHSLMVAANLALHMGLSRLSYCAYYLGRSQCLVDRQAPLWSKMLSISKAYCRFSLWHVACDGGHAQTPAGAQARASNEGHRDDHFHPCGR